MDKPKVLELTITQFITQLGKELSIQDGVGIFGRERQLIALVQHCPFLYDKHTPDFKDTQKKNEAWDVISRIFGVSVGEILTKWKNMRDKFNKFRKNSDDGDKKVTCPYFDDMKFLEPFILSRRVGPTRIGITQLTDEDSDDTPSNGTSKSLSDTKKSMLDDTIHFIETVKAFPVLYHHKYSKITHKKSRAIQWKQLAKSLGISVQDCLDRWKNLRERYSRERRQMIDGKIATKWRLFDDLSFLGPHIQQRRTFLSGRISSGSETRKNSTDKEESTETDLLHTDFLTDVSLPKSDQMEDVEFFDVSNNIHEFTADSLSNSYKRGISDEDDLFGQTITAELRRISCPKKKMKLKADIYRLFYQTFCD